VTQVNAVCYVPPMLPRTQAQREKRDFIKEACPTGSNYGFKKQLAVKRLTIEWLRA
jgi:hypothetical protein